MGKLKQFGLLLWKNYVLQKRKIFVTLLEVGLPAMFALLLIEIRHITQSTLYTNVTTWPQCNIQTLPNNDTLPRRLGYFPENNATRTVMSMVRAKLDLDNVKGFDTEEEMVTFLMMNNGTKPNINMYLGGVGFTSGLTDGNFSDKIAYKIRLSSYPRNSGKQHFKLNPFLQDSSWKTNLMFPIFQKVGPRVPKDRCGGDPGYQREGFLAIQNAISSALFKLRSPQHRQSLAADTTLLLRRHPYPPYNDDNFVLVIQKQFPLIIMLSFVITALNIVKDIVHEKERKLKESMKMMGLSSWLHWAAWFVKYLLFMAISILLMTIFYCVSVGDQGSVIGKTHPTVLFVFLLVYSIASISFCFTVSVFFSKANSAAAAGGILFFCSYIPYFFIQPRYERLSWGEKIAGCLDFNVAMAFGGQVIGMFEGTGSGAQWSNLNTGVSIDDNFTMLHVLLMLLLDAVIYGLITWYVEAVFPGEYGVPQPWYFPFLGSYWCGMVPSDYLPDDIPLSTGQSLEFFEKDPVDLKAGVQIRSLCKVFGKGDSAKTAVADMTLNMYEGQITALLGHNGAGKTTTMSMLTGFIPPTSGTAIVNGFDIRKDMGSIRSSLGLCPQHDILFDTLTVEEHLIFFSKLKGLQSSKVSAEVEKMLENIGLQNKRKALSKTLSGGMKRRLSIGIALIADSKVVILDEPSSGLDPDARHHIWTVLQNNRAGRTMLLTTHYMDEADVLGNRIAIMSNGVVKCCGSSLFLKRKYGAGYHMVIVKMPSCEVERITEVVQSYVPHAALESNVGAELSYILPQESSTQFEGLFLKLQQEQQELGISSFGASVTTMEEVFLKVGGDEDHNLRDRLKRAAVHAVADISLTESSSATNHHLGADVSVNGTSSRQSSSKTAVRRNFGLRRYTQQFYAMFLKRVFHTLRNVLVTATQLGIPLFFTIMALIVVKTFPGPQDSPPLKISITKFGRNFVAYSTPLNLSGQFQQLTDAYRRQFVDTETVVTDVNTQPGFKSDPDLVAYLAERAEDGIGQYNIRYMVAANFRSGEANKSEVVAYFNNQAYHSPAVSLAAAAAAALQYVTDNVNQSLEVTNHPLPRTPENKVNDQITQGSTGFTIAFNVVFGMAFLASSFALFLVKERTVKAKHLQVVSGMHPLTFWLATFIWDLVNYLVPCLLLLLAFLAFDVQPFLQDGHWAHILLLFFMYGWGMLPFIYLVSFLFSVPSTAFVWITMFNILSGVACLLVVGILSIPQLQLLDTAHLLEWIFLVVLPNFCLGQGLSDYYSNHEFLAICEPFVPFCPLIPPVYQNVSCCPGRCGDTCIEFNSDYLSWQPGGIGRMLVFLGIQGVVYFSGVFLIESQLPQKLLYQLWGCCRKTSVPVLHRHLSDSLVQEDEDVARERIRLTNTPVAELIQSDQLFIQELSKWYGSILAVDRLSVGIPHGECFGLLGINGAGKTTTFKMLTGDEMLSSGEAYLDGFSVKTQISEVQQRLGYCPQFDALIDQLTGRETLFLYGRLRGVQEDILPSVVQELMDSLLLTQYADKQVQTYSGGNKRKLSTGIALVGDPPIIFLDEPTTGMDPVARRLLWNTLSDLRDSGRTLILTSHSMEECEALCTRLAIMVNGQFRCLGSQQHLKTKFGEGYTLLARIAFPSQGSPDLQPLMAFVETSFPGSVLKDAHQCSVHYHITDTCISWAHIFGTLERAKVELGIEDYLVSQTTLEQVFINFAHAQLPPADPQTGCCGNGQLLSFCYRRCHCCQASSYTEMMEE